MNTAWSESSNSWPATAYHNKLPDGKANGRIATAGHELIFSAGGVPSLRLPLDGLDIRYGGFNNQQAFLSHPALPEWTFLCADPGLIKDDIIRRHPVHGKLAARKARASRKWPWPVKAMIFLTLLFMAGIATLWMNRAAISDWIAGKIPADAEKQLGELVFEQQVKPTAKFSTDPALKAQLDAVTARLLPAIGETRYEFKFHIIENETINAFAVPGGHIVVHTGLLQRAKRPEEVAGVLAHEIAHITRRHSLRNMVSSLGTMVIIQAVFGDYSGLAQGASTLLEQSYSRDFEREADATGWQYLLDANIDPSGMTDFFRIIREEEKKTGTDMSGALEFLSTHPDTEERIASMEERFKALPKDRRFELIVPAVPAAP
jgi:Zn-dependent protease with chaperone function